MKNYVLGLLAILISINLNAQKLNPVSWTFEAVELENKEYNIVIKASVEDKWYLYSQNNSDEGPVPTSFDFKKSEDFELIGKVEELGELIESYDEFFELDVKKYKTEVQFVQKVKLSNPGVLEGELEFMCCDNKRCLPPKTITFTLNLE